MPGNLSFEVGTVFKVVDRGSAVLEKIGKQVAKINDQIEWAQLNLSKLGMQNFGKLDANLKKVQDQFTALNNEIDAGITSMTAATDAAGASARNLAAQWRAVQGAAARAATATQVATRAGTGGVGGGSRGGGLHVGPPSVPLGGGYHLRGGGLVGQAAVGALGYGLYEQAQLDDFAYRGVFTAGVPADQMKAIQDIIKRQATVTGASIPDLGEAALDEIRQLGGTGLSWQKKLDVLGPLLTYGAAEGRLKGTSTKEGVDSIIGLAHMLKVYDPQKIASLADKFAYLSTVNPAKLEQMERASGYAIPFLSEIGYDPFQIMMLQAAMMRGGILNTKSGTWLRELGKRALPGTNAMSRTAFLKHESALRALGLVDPNNQPTWFSNGAPDMVKLLETASQHLQQMPIAQRAGIMQQLFGSQGSGAMAFLSDPKILKMLPDLEQEMNRFRSGPALFKNFAENSPVQQFRQTWADLRNVLMDIGNVVLPPLTRGLHNFDDVLKDFWGNVAKMLPMAAGAAAGYRIAGAPGAFVGGLLGAAAPQPMEQSAAPFDWWSLVPHTRSDFGVNPGSPADRMLDWLEGDQNKKTIKQGTQEGVEDALKNLHKSAFFGGNGATPMLVPASYTSGGGLPLDGGVFYGGGGGGVPRIGRHPMGRADINKALNGTAGLSGNAFVKASRAGFAKEMQDPNKRLAFAAMLLSEGTPLPTAESAMNRSAYAHKSLMQMLHSGFYGPINRGQLPAFEARLRRDPKLMAKMNRAIEQALGGSNTLHGFTDQGLRSDPNGAWIMRHEHILGKGNIFGDWGGGPGGHAGAAAWRHHFEAQADGADSVPMAASVPPGADNAHHTHITVNLDGKKIAKNSVKHITRMGNMPSTGARLPSAIGTVPLLI